MSKIVVGLFDRLEDAQATLRELLDHGFRREDISLIANDASGDYSKHIHSSDDTTDDMGASVASGAGLGAIIGGLGGLLVGLGALAIPGIGPVLAAGPLVSALAGAGIGAAAGGLLGALVEAGIPEEQANWYAEGVRRGGTLVTVNASDEMSSQAVNIMNRHNPIDIEKRAQEWRSQNWQGFSADSQPMTRQDIDQYRSTTLKAGDEATLPVVEEELQVGKREVQEGGVRVQTHTTEHPVEEQVNLRKERVDVERRPVDRPVSTHDQDLFKEGTIEVTQTSEEPIVHKEARIVEEVVVRKDVEHETETIHDTVRRTDVEVEEFGTRNQNTDFSGADDYDQFYRTHYNTNYGNTSFTYDQYRPYYQYGSRLASDNRFRNRSWNEIEMDARRDWERDHPDSLWDDIKDAVRTGWETVTGRR